MTEVSGLIPVLTKSTGVLETSTVGVHFWISVKNFHSQISPDPDESFQPLYNYVNFLYRSPMS